MHATSYEGCFRVRAISCAHIIVRGQNADHEIKINLETQTSD